MTNEIDPSTLASMYYLIPTPSYLLVDLAVSSFEDLDRKRDRSSRDINTTYCI